MSALETIGTLLSLLAVFLTVKRSILCWPIWILATLTYTKVFWDAKLYADFGLQGFFILLEIYGWVEWKKEISGQKTQPKIRGAYTSEKVFSLLFVLFFGGGLGFVLKNYTDAALPWLDSICAALSIAGTWFQARKVLACWGIFVVADIIYVGIYLNKELWFTSGLYLFFLGMAIAGYFEWQKSMVKNQAPN